MYILMVVDSNKESKIVALWLVVYEDKDTISHTTNTKCVMCDKDMTERDVLAEKMLNAVLMMSISHPKNFLP